MKKLMTRLLAASMVCSLLVGTGLTETKAENATDKPYAGTTISILLNSSAQSTFIQEHLAEFTEETGIQVNCEQLSNDQLNTKILVSMAAGGKDLDMFMFMAYQNTLQYVQNGWLEPLNEYYADDAEFDIDDFMEGGITAGTVDDKLYGIPICSEHVIVFYNKAMIEEAGIDVSAIQTYEDLEEACKTVEEKLDGVHGIALRGSGNGAIVIVISLARAYGGDYLDADGNAAINSEAFCKGVEVYRDLLQYAQEGASTMSWSETCNVFAQKQTAFRIDSDAQYTYLIDPSSSLVAEDELGFLALPAGDVCAATSQSNWSYGISSGSEHKEAAWELIRWMNTKEAVVKAAVEYNAEPARISGWEDEEVLAAYPEGYADCKIASGEIANGNTLPNMLYSTEARTVMGEALDEIFAGGDIQTCMDEANAAVQELLDQEAAEAAESATE